MVSKKLTNMTVRTRRTKANALSQSIWTAARLGRRSRNSTETSGAIRLEVMLDLVGTGPPEASVVEAQPVDGDSEAGCFPPPVTKGISSSRIGMTTESSGRWERSQRGHV